MATYNTAFGALPSTKTLTGRTNTVGATPEDERRPRNFTQQFGAQRQGGQQQPAQTFAQLQQQGMARPAPPQAPQAPQFGQFGGSQQAQQLRTQLQQQLGQAAQAPSRFDTQAFQQIRGAQQANLQAEYGAQRKALDEEMARRGLFASSVTAGRMGDLAGQQARAAADIDAQLLQRAAETQAQDRAQLMQQFQGLSELAGAQDLAAFEANRVAQAAQAEQALRTAQFQQGQFEAGGAQALSAAQAQEAAMRAQQELGLRAGELTGQVGGMGTLAAQQQAEQRRQFDIRQALEQQLGLGGLSLQQRQQQAQEQQFGVSTAEQQRQFNIQQALQQQLGLGGLDVQRGELGLRQQQLQQQMADTAAERTLREQMQTRELTAQEAQQVRDIESRKALQTQQITEQARQFGLQLGEQQAARVYQGGFTAQELGIKRQQVDAQIAAENRQMTETERNNLAIRGLERDRFESDKDFRADQLNLNRDELDQRAAQIQEDQRLRGVEIDDQRAYREAEIEARTTQIANEFTRSGQQINVENARIQAQRDISAADNTAQMNRLNAQLTAQATEGTAERVARQALQTQQIGESALERQLRERLGLMEATGNVYTAGVGGAAQLATGQAAGQTLAAQQQRLQARQVAFQQAAAMSEQSGVQHTVDADGNVVPLRDAQNNPVRTSAFTQAEEARKQQSEQFNVSQFGEAGTPRTGTQTLAAQEAGIQRSQLAFQNAARLSEQSGVQYTVNAEGQPEIVRDAAGNPVRTSAFTQAEEQRKQQETLTKLDLNLRRQLGLTEATGRMYNIDPLTGQATLAVGAPETLGMRQLGLQEAGVTGTFEGNLTQQALQNAYDRAAQLSQVTGQQYTVNPQTGQITAGTDTLAARLQQAGVTGKFGGALTQSALQNAYDRAAQLSQITGTQYTVDPATGQITAGSARTFAADQVRLDRELRRQLGLSELSGVMYDEFGQPSITQTYGNGQMQRTERQTLAARTADLDRQLRSALGMSEATGFVYDPITGARTGAETVQGQLARNQMLMSLAQALGGLSPERITALFGPGSGNNQENANDPGTWRPGSRVGAERPHPNGTMYVWNGSSWMPKTISSGNENDASAGFEGERRKINGKWMVFRGGWWVPDDPNDSGSNPRL
jgi:hypothetical protein